VISKLPRWVEYGSFVLALVAGLINSIGLLGFKHQAVSHLSGTATLLGTGIITSSFTDVLHLTFVILSFVIGSVISGYFLRSGALKLGRNYSGLLVLEALFILGSSYLLVQGSVHALVTTYSGAVIRTTHLTGIFTDLGIMLGARLRGQPFDKRKASLFILIIAGFISGGTLGAYFFNVLNFYALYIPAGICLLLACSYSVYNAKVSRI
jgi:uncharacterized membrane protein YoaK (UPF0700 family)